MRPEGKRRNGHIGNTKDHYPLKKLYKEIGGMWYENLDKNSFLKSLYNQIPDLKSVRIEKIELDRGGEDVSLVFDLPIYPTNIPKKWESRLNDTVSVEVDFNIINSFKLEINSGYMYGDIEIELEDDMIEVIISGNVNCSYKAEYAFIQKITSYKK